MKKTTATCTWALAAAVAAAVLLATVQTSYAGHGKRDKHRSPARSACIQQRRSDKSKDHQNRHVDRWRLAQRRPYERYDRPCRLRRPPVRHVRVVYVVPVQLVGFRPILIHSGCLFLRFGVR